MYFAHAAGWVLERRWHWVRTERIFRNAVLNLLLLYYRINRPTCLRSRCGVDVLMPDIPRRATLSRLFLAGTSAVFLFHAVHRRPYRHGRGSLVATARAGRVGSALPAGSWRYHLCWLLRLALPTFAADRTVVSLRPPYHGRWRHACDWRAFTPPPRYLPSPRNRTRLPRDFTPRIVVPTPVRVLLFFPLPLPLPATCAVPPFVGTRTMDADGVFWTHALAVWYCSLRVLVCGAFTTLPLFVTRSTCGSVPPARIPTAPPTMLPRTGAVHYLPCRFCGTGIAGRYTTFTTRVPHPLHRHTTGVDTGFAVTVATTPRCGFNSAPLYTLQDRTFTTFSVAVANFTAAGGSDGL